MNKFWREGNNYGSVLSNKLKKLPFFELSDIISSKNAI